MLKWEMSIDIVGLGFILYSPTAASQISEGSDYVEMAFWKAKDIARHVMACQITTFCTGSPGSFVLRFVDGPMNEEAVRAAEFQLELGLEIRDSAICVRDLYDLMRWNPVCPMAQQLSIANGWYRLTVYSSTPASGILGDNQIIDIHLDKVPEMPSLHYQGTPLLCD